jgi:hypothetical protein
MMVMVKVGPALHGVMCPVFDDPESAARLVRFLQSDHGRFEAKLMERQGDQWAMAKAGRVVEWPVGHFSNPLSSRGHR